jgi:putative CRISPR-associated protein (TIGR02619 family)
MKQAQTLISTVGTSLFFPNVQGLKVDDADPIRRALATAYAAREWTAVAEALSGLPATDRLCGAEMNSLASLFAKRYANPQANLYFVHSATDDGRSIAKVLERYYQRAGHPRVVVREVEDLQDSDPKRFRTKGLRNLAKVVCKIIRDHGPDSCAINATGGYKAQIAIAVLMGQALGVPVYYKHERFDEIIAFPPMPVSLNFEVWMRLSGLLFTLAREGFVPAVLWNDQDRDGEVLESLVERTEIDARPYLELSPTGQIFHETFRERFRSQRDQVLPPAVPASQKQPPALKGHDVIDRHREAIGRHLTAVTQQVPQVKRCSTCWCSPDCPLPNHFRIHGDQIEGAFSDSSFAVKFLVETLAATDGQREAVVAALNEWLDESGR